MIEVREHAPSGVASVLHWIIHRLLSIGVRITILGPMMLLSVRGRKSGELRTMPIDVHDMNDRRYLIATHGIGNWVLNLRASQEGTLRLGRRRMSFKSRELSQEEAGPVIRDALGHLIASNGLRGTGVRNHLSVTKESPLSDYVRAARTHPVFELDVRALEQTASHHHAHSTHDDDR